MAPLKKFQNLKSIYPKGNLIGKYSTTRLSSNEREFTIRGENCHPYIENQLQGKYLLNQVRKSPSKEKH